ncbi:MAG: Uma2 family endonuclease [Gemmataceae bacterium]
MTKLTSSPWTAADYEQAAIEYCQGLPLEHFMEAIPAATQRTITLESFDLLSRYRPEVQCFNELLIQYWFGNDLRRVVPDNFARLCDQPLTTEWSFNMELEPVGPLLVLEYVSRSHPRKDYRTNYLRYEQELGVPYYLLFYPERQDLRLHHLVAGTYQRLAPNARGRLEIPELELEVALLDEWVRYWFRGELLELPGALQQKLEQERQRTEQERQRAEQERQRAEQERQRAEQERQRAEQEQQRAEQEQQRAEQEQQRRLEVEAENARLRALVEELQAGTKKRRRRRDPP